jgi:TctA family transporter
MQMNNYDLDKAIDIINRCDPGILHIVRVHDWENIGAFIIFAFGLIGYWLIKHDFEPAPLLLGMVLGPLMEENLRRALLISRGDWSVFVTRPLSAVLMAIAAGLLVLTILPSLRKKRDEVFVESEN